ncbi:hypothetical protein [Actinomyces radicidentis]|uniref:hypothetical protein n=1 Tax=Actinomyces radicidentis TaxID=111015 RepID=UPI0028E4FB19|nr:hypothetical protein [Actinomyces radicidentis]
MNQPMTISADAIRPAATIDKLTVGPAPRTADLSAGRVRASSLRGGCRRPSASRSSDALGPDGHNTGGTR